MCRCLSGSGGAGSEQPIWCCVLGLGPKQHRQKEPPQCCSFCWTALPSLQDFCFLWAPSRSRGGGLEVGTQLGQLIHSDQRHSKTFYIMLSSQGRAAGWGGAVFPNHHVLRSWVCIALLMPNDGFFICFFIFFIPISYYIVFVSQPSRVSCFCTFDWLHDPAGREWVGTDLWAEVCPLHCPTDFWMLLKFCPPMRSRPELLSWLPCVKKESWKEQSSWTKCFLDNACWYWCAIRAGFWPWIRT